MILVCITLLMMINLFVKWIVYNLKNMVSRFVFPMSELAVSTDSVRIKIFQLIALAQGARSMA